MKKNLNKRIGMGKGGYLTLLQVMHCRVEQGDSELSSSLPPLSEDYGVLVFNSILRYDKHLVYIFIENCKTEETFLFYLSKLL